jgi:hypothetical protein
MSRPSARASPNQNDEKSPDPFASALVRSGSEAWVARGKAGGAPKAIRADLHGRRAKREGGSDATRIGDAACGDDRDWHRVDDLRHERECADLGIDVCLDEHAAVASGLGALDNDDIGAVLIEPARLLGARRRAQDFAAGGLDAPKLWCWQAEMKARDRRAQLRRGVLGTKCLFEVRRG